MDKYLEAEKRLAELLGYRQERGLWFYYPNAEPHYEVDPPPHWCRNWSACGPLMVEHRILVHPMENEVVGAVVYSHIAAQPAADRQPIEVEPIQAWYSDHPDRDTAVRFAIVQAVIAKLEA